MQLSEMKDSLDSEDVMSFLFKVIEVQFPNFGFLSKKRRPPSVQGPG
jgi:hypothetical protein